MKINHVIGYCCLTIGLLFAAWGLPRFNNAEKFWRPPGEVAAIKERILQSWVNASEVSLRKGQIHEAHLPRPYGDDMFCLFWETENNRSKLDVQAALSGNDQGQYQSTVLPLCAQHTAAKVIFRSQEDQVIRFSFLQQNSVPSYDGHTSDVCQNCNDMPSFDQISNLNVIRDAGRNYLTFAGLATASSLVFFIGPLLILSFFSELCYRARNFAFPSARASKVRDALNRAKTGATFETASTHDYDGAATNAFRRRQDIDDLADLTGELQAETERLQHEEAQLKMAAATEEAEERRLTEEYEATVRRLQKIQEELEKKNSSER